MVELTIGALNVEEILNHHYRLNREENFGAIVNFIGVVRDENSIEGLSFDVYEPILNSWFNSWQTKAKKRDAKIFMAHSIGNVPLHESSFIASVVSPKRRVALELIDTFVEDFKANAPIWKYDLINKERVYAKDRSHKVVGSGILA